jgi:O-antigen ligase
MIWLERRGSLLTLFFIAVTLVLMHIASTKGLPLTPWWLGLVVPLFIAGNSSFPRRFSLPGVLFILFCLTLLVQALFFSPVYDAKAIFLPFALLLPFLAFSRLSCDSGAFRVQAGAVSVMSYVALILWFNGTTQGRAHGIFGTPNTFATYINLVLAPMLAYYLLGRGGKGVFALLMLLFITLLAAQSRGGYLGLTASMGIFLLLYGISGLRSNVRRAKHVLLGFAGAVALIQWFMWAGVNGEAGGGVPLSSPQSSMERLQLYAAAWEALKQHFPVGTGMYTFRYYFEIFKPATWSDRFTSFVHNDYLQLATENGLLGIGLLVAVLAALYFCLWKGRFRALEEHRLPLILSSVGVTSLLAHGMVDFPFYVPLFQAILGAYLGVINRQLVEMDVRCFAMPALTRWRPPGISMGFIRLITFTALVTWLGLPVFARAAAEYGLILLKQGDSQGGVYWHSIARNLQPREFMYYWREGLVWVNVGISRHDTRLVEKGDAIFAKGVEVNPLDVMILMERIKLRRLHQDLLLRPTSPEQVMAWMAQAKKLKPHAADVQMEYVYCLKFYGRRKEAIEQAELLLKMHPNANYAKRLLENARGAE